MEGRKVVGRAPCRWQHTRGDTRLYKLPPCHGIFKDEHLCFRSLYPCFLKRLITFIAHERVNSVHRRKRYNCKSIWLSHRSLKAGDASASVSAISERSHIVSLRLLAPESCSRRA